MSAGANDNDAQVAKVRALYPQAEALTHLGKTIVLIRKAKFKGAGQDQEMDLLLYPHPGLGYETRLFYASQLAVGQNWTQHTICQQTWWSPSREKVSATLDWDVMLATHLRAAAA